VRSRRAGCSAASPSLLPWQGSWLGHRGPAGDPLYGARRTLRTGEELLTDRQRARLEALFDGDDHAQVEVTWGVYQNIGYLRPEGCHFGLRFGVCDASVPQVLDAIGALNVCQDCDRPRREVPPRAAACHRASPPPTPTLVADSRTFTRGS
jgi:hypothetical protein